MSVLGYIPGSVAPGVCIPDWFPDPKGDGWVYKEVSFERLCDACEEGTMRQYYHGDYFKFECDECGFLYDTGVRMVKEREK